MLLAIMGSQSVTCHPTQVNTVHPALFLASSQTARQVGTRFTYPGGMEG